MNRCLILVSAWIFTYMSSNAAISIAANNVQFDVLPVAVASDVEPPSNVYVPPGHRWVKVHLHISALIDTSAQQPYEFLYQIACTSGRVRVVDYDPATTLHDTAIGGIVVEQSSEESRSAGLNLNGHFQGITATGNGNSQQKTINKTKAEQIAPREVIAASGTIHRATGVYFKLRSTPTHVLEGRKRFSITLQVPESWRGELMDIRMQTLHHSAKGYIAKDCKECLLSPTRFMIAVFDEHDDAARHWAWLLSESEQRLREVALQQSRAIRSRSLPTIFHHFAAAIDVIEPKISKNWLRRVLFEDVDPYFDKQIQHLPVDVKVAVLDFIETKRQYRAMLDGSNQSQEAHSELVVN